MPTVLSVAYPLAPVAPDATGGAEQILSTLESGLVRRGWRSIVVACTGSRVAGRLVATPRTSGGLDEPTIAATRSRTADVVARVVAAGGIDLVHMHGFDFATYLPPAGVPVLATLHCPADWYEDAAFTPTRPLTWLHAVSRSQHATLPASPRLPPPIDNGISLDAVRLVPAERRRFALVLGRIAPEKGIDLALDAARAAGLPMLVAGELFDYPGHRRHFTREITPRLDAARRWIGPVGRARKHWLLARARCLVVASRAAETSSLAAREALACGTPVVAVDRGAMAETVRHGVTGLLVSRPEDLAGALADVARIDPAACRADAVARFDAERMIDRYEEAYALIMARARSAAPAAETVP